MLKNKFNDGATKGSLEGISIILSNFKNKILKNFCVSVFLLIKSPHPALSRIFQHFLIALIITNTTHVNNILTEINSWRNFTVKIKGIVVIKLKRNHPKIDENTWKNFAVGQVFSSILGLSLFYLISTKISISQISSWMQLGEIE